MFLTVSDTPSAFACGSVCIDTNRYMQQYGETENQSKTEKTGRFRRIPDRTNKSLKIFVFGGNAKKKSMHREGLKRGKKMKEKKTANLNGALAVRSDAYVVEVE